MQEQLEHAKRFQELLEVLPSALCVYVCLMTFLLSVYILYVMLSVENVINVIQQLILDTFIYIIRASYVFMFKWIKPKNCASLVIRRSALRFTISILRNFQIIHISFFHVFGYQIISNGTHT